MVSDGRTFRPDALMIPTVEPSRWQRMDWLREHSARRGQRACGMSALVDEVTLQRNPETGKANYGGLLTCGSRTCPNCGPRIAAATRTDIEKAIAAWMPPPPPAPVSFVDAASQAGEDEDRTPVDVRSSESVPGRKLWFGTFTIRHKRGQGFAELANAVSKCWAAATGGRGWMRDREAHGVAHYLRVFEQKVSTRNGWHIHVHVLFFVDDSLPWVTSSNHTELLESMFKRWSRKAVAMGFGVPLIRAQDMHEVDSSRALDKVAEYFAKETTDASERAPGSIAAEMSNAAGKQGKVSLTPGQLLAWAMRGEDYIAQLWGPASDRQRGRGIQGQEFARHLYREFELGMKGRRTIAWSQGMREALGLGAELTDAELAERQEQSDAATRDTVAAMSGADWRKFVARPGRRAQLVELAESGASPGELCAWLAGFGVTASPHRKGRELDDTGPVWFADLPTPF
jgi:hypothetical protein